MENRTGDSGLMGDSRFRELVAILRGIGGAHCATHLESSITAASVSSQTSLVATHTPQNPFFQHLRLPRQQDVASWLRSVQVAQELSWEALHTGPWRDVHVAWRDAYAVSGLLMAAHQVSQKELLTAMRTLDMAVLMGGPRYRTELEDSIQNLTRMLGEREGNGGTPLPQGEGGEDAVDRYNEHQLGSPVKGKESEISATRKRNREEEEDGNGWGVGGGDKDGEGEEYLTGRSDLPPGAFASLKIERIHLPSLEEFLCDVLLPAVPTILAGAMDHWAARDRWRDPNYLKKVGGARTVPIEVGANYLAPEWSQELMPLGTFLDRHMSTESVKKGGVRYLAQHPLLDQIPALALDISTPDYCSVGGGEFEVINAWIGPRGTVTPLHHDPHHNLLAQVVGRKYVRVYDAGAGAGMYPHQDSMLRNSSQVDLDSPDANLFPLFSGLPYRDCILDEGEMLYLPPKCWHYVRSLSPSASVSFWWKAGGGEGGGKGEE